MKISWLTLKAPPHKLSKLLDLPVLALLILLVSCIPEQHDGVNLVLPSSDPPASSILWSPVDPDQLLVTAIDEVQRHTQVSILDTVTMEMNIISDVKPGDVRGVSWSPNGKSVVIAKYLNREDDEQGLWIWNVDNRTSEYVGEVGDSISWSPKGNDLAVFRRPPALYLIDIETKQERLLFSAEEKKYTFGLSWSPDGTSIVFSMGDFERSDLYVLDIKTGEIAQISSYGNNADPAWSPKGNMIVYWKHFYSETEKQDISSLHLTNVDGTCDMEIPHTKSALSPTWSPDGERLAVLQNREIYFIDLDVVFGRDIAQDLCP